MWQAIIRSLMYLRDRQIGLFRFVAAWTTRILQRLTVQDSPQPATEDTDSDSEEDSINLDPNHPRLIKTDELDYVAFSHVWGNWEWRKVPGIPYEVKVSQEKAEFIANDLPALVGDGAFWMDTLTVDQRNAKEVLAIVDSIPAIFKMAKRTIAVRESDGFYDCCMKAVEGFEDPEDFGARFIDHHAAHYDYACVESYLQRLWTLQECLLSHTIQFVVPRKNNPTKRRVARAHDVGHYASMVDATVVQDSLRGLAYCFSGLGADAVSPTTEFLRAYVHGGTVVKPRNEFFMEQEDIHSGAFMAVNLASRRVATMPRDYIFATMPQFPWYKYPRKKAFKMTFGEIYMDLYQQSANAGHAFTCRFTNSMLDPTDNDPVSAWLPSKHQPSPRCLGDFLKLMGNRVPEISNGNARHVHLTTVVTTMEYCYATDPDTILAILETSMRWFQEQWQESHSGGEISKFGNYPSAEWILDYFDAMECGWVCKDPRWRHRVLEDGDKVFVNYGPGIDYDEDDLLETFSSQNVFDTEDTEPNEDAKHLSLFQQTSRILDHMWCAHNPILIDRSQKADWRVFKRQMRARWSTPLLRTMLLFAAMIVCRIPLSAAGWVNRLFVPVYVRYGDSEAQGLVVPGLLAKTARQEESARGQPRRMYSVGQHLPPVCAGPPLPFGKDHFLVDPERKVPVGILPDFLPHHKTDEEFVRATSALYAGTCEAIGKNQVKIGVTPLSEVRWRPNRACRYQGVCRDNL